MDYELLSLALEWCSRLFISDKYAYEAISFLDNMTQTMKTRLHIKTGTKNLKQCSLAYCLYRCCRQDECFITIDKICQVSGCSKKLIWRSVKLDSDISIALLKPQHLLQRYTADLCITREEKKEVGRLCFHYSKNIGHSPKTILGYCLYSVLQNPDGRRELFREGKSRVTVKNICQHLNMSPTCLFRFKKLAESSKIAVGNNKFDDNNK